MSKRSNFAKIPRDCYDTPAAASDTLLRHINKSNSWIEPCAGRSALSNALRAAGVTIVHEQDIEPRGPGIVTCDGADLPPAVDGLGIVTNPPFTRATFRRLLTSWLIEQQREVWLLHPAGFLFNQWFAKTVFPRHMAEVVGMPRLKWFPGTPHTETNDHIWVRYTPAQQSHVKFHPRHIGDSK